MKAATPMFSRALESSPSPPADGKGTSPFISSVGPSMSSWNRSSLIGNCTMMVSSLTNIGLSVPDELNLSIRKQAHIVRRLISRSTKLSRTRECGLQGSYSKSRCSCSAYAMRIAIPPSAQLRPP